jgi:hypothetical protein
MVRQEVGASGLLFAKQFLLVESIPAPVVASEVEILRVWHAIVDLRLPRIIGNHVAIEVPPLIRRP